MQPPVTRRVIHDPFTAFTDSLLSRFFTVSNPILLYTMNTAGIPTNPAYLTSAAPSSQGSSMEFCAIRAEIDDVRQQGITAMGSVTNSIQRFQTVTSELVEQGNHTVAALSAMSRSSAASTRLNSTMMHLHFLRNERSMLDFQLLSTGQSLPPTHPLCLRAAQLGDEVQRQQQQVDRLMTESQTLDSLLMPLVNSLPSVPLQAIGSSPPTVLGNEEGEVSRILDQMEEVRNLHPSRTLSNTPSSRTYDGLPGGCREPCLFLYLGTIYLSVPVVYITPLLIVSFPLTSKCLLC